MTDKNVEMPPLLVIGASTGGPGALRIILSKFPADVSFATVVIQHVDEHFQAGFSEWLSKQTRLPVEIAKIGHAPSPGKVYLVGQHKHLYVNDSGEFNYTSVSRNKIYCPSIDFFFQSLAKVWTIKSVAVLLTGMGSDGAEGMLALKKAGWFTIAQNQETSIVFGMPKAAIEQGAIEEVLPLGLIGDAVLHYFKKRSEILA